MKKKLAVTIGIPAHNEEKNIGNLLKSILSQKGNFKLDSVLVICDGCTDKTSDVVMGFLKKDPRIKLFNDGKRLGKSTRLNQLFNRSVSEILLLLDADTLPKNNDFVSEILKEFRNKKVGLVGGHDTPCKAITFKQRIVNSGVELWFEVRKALSKKDSIHNVHGSVYAVRKIFYQNHSLPKEVINDDMYIYLKAYQLGFKSSFAEKAITYYQTPTTLKDFYNQTKRFSVGREQINNIFGRKSAKYFAISKKTKIIGVLNYMKKNPLNAILAISLQLSISWVLPHITSQYSSKGIWKQISSTKEVITI